ncbi:hypothetical protein DEO72_LG3g1209 [Vigna unguiculata]|uniref:Replication factor A C-terminal domain-containing protein n=1 Tax=Vigna unguiculata TaxID=3917 RepID=A0A4D6LEJ7_VIGUN|nr:hypothetical protein DEO72_LG3g1209 [Vigna unguiculata]
MSLSEVQTKRHNVSEVTLAKENWNIIVKVIRSWFVPDFSKQRYPFSMEMFENTESPSQGLTQLSQSSKHSLKDEFLSLTLRNDIQGLKDCKQVTTYVVFGTIKYIITEEDWWYTSCVCNKVVYPDSNMFFCEKCNSKDIYAGNGEFSREKERIIKDSYVDVAEITCKMFENTESPSQGLTQLSQSSKHSLKDEFLSLTLRNDIQGLKDCKQVTTYVVFGTIKYIITEEDWWYTSCVCNKVVYPDSNMFFCEKCNSKDIYAGNGEFSREKERIIKDSYVDVAELCV